MSFAEHLPRLLVLLWKIAEIEATIASVFYGGISMGNSLSASAQKVQNVLEKMGFDFQVVELAESTRTAADAAQAVGCEVGQIVKSLIFKTKKSGRPVLIVASGTNRVNVKKVAGLVGESLGKADADFVRQRTGFAIGGVPPVAHAEPVETYVDRDLLRYDVIWAAAGTPHAVFRLSPQALVSMTGGQVVEIV